MIKAVHVPCKVAIHGGWCTGGTVPLTDDSIIWKSEYGG